jgi:DNA invertase Pin-like site-specific DNA recombinase
MVIAPGGTIRPAATREPVTLSPLGVAPSFTGVRFGLYTRISDDADDDAKGVARQEADERAWVTSVGGIVHEPIYEENDTSAYKKKRIVQPDGSWIYRVIRPVWQRMLADLRAGVIDAVIVADLDRLARDPRDLEDAIEIVEHFRRPIVGLTGGFDLLTDGGKFTARILVAMANKSSADTARRVRRWHLDMQQNGKITGGPRPFGWNDDRRTLHPVESPIIVRAVGRLLDGVPITAIVTEWNREAGAGRPGQADAAQPAAVWLARPDRLRDRPGDRRAVHVRRRRPRPRRRPGRRRVGTDPHPCDVGAGRGRDRRAAGREASPGAERAEVSADRDCALWGV